MTGIESNLFVVALSGLIICLGLIISSEMEEHRRRIEKQIEQDQIARLIRWGKK